MKNYSKKQKKLASVAAPRNKITGADFKKLKGYRKGGVSKKSKKS